MKYQLLSPLRAEEREALKRDIAKRGVLVPVEYDADTGDILDGHNRAEIAAELGIGFPRVERSFANDQERREHVLKLNLLRRHLGVVGWAQAFEQLLRVRGVEVRPGPKTDPNSATVAEIARELGVPDRTADWRRQLARELEPHPDLAEKVDIGEMAPSRARRVIREREAEGKREESKEAGPTPPEGFDIAVGDVGDMGDIPANSIDLIFTDPPYPAKYLPAWEDLAKLAAHALKPSGLLVAYSGQYHLPEVMYALSDLEYVWLGALVTPGAHNQVQRRHVRSACKPILFYAKPDYEPGEWFDDAYISESREKANHPWEQSVGAARYYIERLTKLGDVVLDPFLGSGTTALACKEIGRRCIGRDIDPDAIATALQRVAA